MKLKIKEIFVAVLAIFFIQNIAFTQTSELNCGFIPSNSNMSVVDPTYGIDKPTRSDLSGGVPTSSDSYFPVLVVFVQFKDDSTYAKNWTMNSAPAYLDSMIAQSKPISGNFWEYYNPNTQILSSQWAELSKGKLHVISPSGAFSVVLPHTALEYWTLASGNRYYAEIMINNDIWQSIRNQGLTDWRMYDR